MRYKEGEKGEGVGVAGWIKHINEFGRERGGYLMSCMAMVVVV